MAAGRAGGLSPTARSGSGVATAAGSPNSTLGALAPSSASDDFEAAVVPPHSRPTVKRPCGPGSFLPRNPDPTSAAAAAAGPIYDPWAAARSPGAAPTARRLSFEERRARRPRASAYITAAVVRGSVATLVRIEAERAQARAAAEAAAAGPGPGAPPRRVLRARARADRDRGKSQEQLETERARLRGFVRKFAARHMRAHPKSNLAKLLAGRA